MKKRILSGFTLLVLIVTAADCSKTAVKGTSGQKLVSKTNQSAQRTEEESISPGSQNEQKNRASGKNFNFAFIKNGKIGENFLAGIQKIELKTIVAGAVFITLGGLAVAQLLSRIPRR